MDVSTWAAVTPIQGHFYRRKNMSQDTVYAQKGLDADLNFVSVVGASPASPLGVATGVTGVTPNYFGHIKQGANKITMDYTAFQAAALTTDLVLCSLPAKSRLNSMVVDTTVAFAGTAGTLAIVVGKTTGGNEFILSHDVKSGVVTKGLADGDLGASLTRAAAVQGGTISSFTAATPLSLRLTSGTGNLSGLNAGSVTVYFTVELL